MFRKSITEDLKQIKDILMVSFNLNENDCTKMLNMIQPFENTFLIEINDEIVSVASAIPFNVGNKQGRYIYAVATKPAHRKKGYAEELLKKIINLYDDMDVLLLKPANEKLYDYYRKIGFNNTIKADIAEYNHNNAYGRAVECASGEYFNLRTKYNDFLFPEYVREYYMAEYEYKTVKNDDTIAMYRLEKNICYIEEIYGTKINELISGIIEKEKVTKALVVQNGNEPFALAYFYNEPFKIDFRIPME